MWSSAPETHPGIGVAHTSEALACLNGALMEWVALQTSTVGGRHTGVHKPKTLLQQWQFVHKFCVDESKFSFFTSGFIIDLLDQIALMLDFGYEVLPVPDGSYGHRMSSGRWDGVVGEVAAKVKSFSVRCHSAWLICNISTQKE